MFNLILEFKQSVIHSNFRSLLTGFNCVHPFALSTCILSPTCLYAPITLWLFHGSCAFPPPALAPRKSLAVVSSGLQLSEPQRRLIHPPIAPLHHLDTSHNGWRRLRSQRATQGHVRPRPCPAQSLAPPSIHPLLPRPSHSATSTSQNATRLTMDIQMAHWLMG